MSLVAFVIPAFDEARNIEPLIEELRAELAKTGDEYDLLFVDDGSRDDTWEVLTAAAARDPAVRAIRLSRNFGKEPAIAAGLEHAHPDADALVVIDADLQHPPSLLPEMIRIWKAEGVEVVEAVRSRRGDASLFYRLSSKLFYKIASRFSGIDLENVTDFKLMDARVVDAWRDMRESNLFFRGMSAWVGFRRRRIPFEAPKRRSGSTRWALLELTRLALVGITAFTSFPLRLVTLAGLLFLCFSVVWGARALVVKLQGMVVDGVTTLILLLLIIGSMVMLGLGIIGEYIARIYQEVKLRPRYVVRESTSSASSAARQGGS